MDARLFWLHVEQARARLVLCKETAHAWNGNTNGLAG